MEGIEIPGERKEGGVAPQCGVRGEKVLTTPV
jgi:hypothetical protein